MSVNVESSKAHTHNGKRNSNATLQPIEQGVNQRQSKDAFNARLGAMLRKSGQPANGGLPANAPRKAKESRHSNDQTLVPGHVDKQNLKPDKPASAQDVGEQLQVQEPNASKEDKRKAEGGKAPPAKRKTAVNIERPSKKQSTDYNGKPLQTPTGKSLRKTALIHFDKSGPQNSGVLKNSSRWKDMNETTLKPKSRLPLSTTPANPKLRSASSTRISSSNAASRKAAGEAVFRPLKEVKDSQPPRVSSQTLIAENGSPIRMGDLDDDGIPDENRLQIEEQSADTPYVRNGDELGDIDMVKEDNHATPARIVVFPQKPRKKLIVPKLICSPKSAPSSPLTRSKFQALDKHVIEANGSFVNLQTKKSVIPIQAQDPFSFDGSARKGAFMDRLRRSSDTVNKRSTAPRQTSKKGKAMQEPPAPWEDPDKTLVEAERALHRRKHKLRRKVGSDSEDSSDEISSSSLPSEEASLISQSEERAPHQQAIYLALLNVVKVYHFHSHPY